MPDLNQIKQVEQKRGSARAVRQGRPGNPRRPRGRRRHVNRAARLLLAGEGEALTPKLGHNDLSETRVCV